MAGNAVEIKFPKSADWSFGKKKMNANFKKAWMEDATEAKQDGDRKELQMLAKQAKDWKTLLKGFSKGLSKDIEKINKAKSQDEQKKLAKKILKTTNLYRNKIKDHENKQGDDLIAYKQTTFSLRAILEYIEKPIKGAIKDNKWKL